ncbi:MAG: hypothetical protein IJI24_07190, partial [Lachnospiraceae bacterium]|nr:hypothetical protein [Lachnospiraceae bacterium]
IAYVGFALYNPARVENFLGLNAEMAGKFWDECLRSYLGTREGQILQEIEDKIRVVAFVRLVEWGGRHLNPNNPEETAERKLWVRELIRLLKTVDTLHFEDTLPAGMEPVDRS